MQKLLIRKDRLLAILLLLPSVVAIAVFVYGFIGWNIRASLSDWVGNVPDYTFAGFTNFANLLQQQRFIIDLRNTAIFTVMFIGSCIAIGFGLAVLLDQRPRGEAIFRSIFLFPMAISFIVTGVVWRWLLNPATSIERLSGLNLLFHQAGLDFLISEWYIHPTLGITAIVIPATWQMSGFVMAMFLAGLRSLPDEVREAARVDGASELQIYRYIALSWLRPVLLSSIIILGHASLKNFDLVMAITQEGGKGFSADVPALNMYYTAFRGLRYGQGAAIAAVILIASAVLIVPYLIHTLREGAEQ